MTGRGLMRFAAVVTLTLCATAAIAADIHGASVMPPAGWQAAETSRIVARFADPAAGESAEVTTVPGIETADDAAFFVAAEAWKAADLGRFTMQSVHFNDLRFNDAACVRYDGIFTDPAAAADDKSQIRLVGYLCRHPKSPTLAIDINFSRRAVEDAMPADSMARAEAFFDSLSFTVPPPGQEG